MKIFVAIDICFLVAFIVLLILNENVNLHHVFAGFAMGWTVHSLLTFFRKSNKKKLR